MNGEQRVVIMEHAVDRLVQRTSMDRMGARGFIRAEVLAAINASRVANRKPKVFRLYRERNRTLLHPHDRVVWTEGRELAWIVRINEREAVVQTTLVRATVPA